jgi:peptidoglycan/LPS O-acetylase OafA/YrhL
VGALIDSGFRKAMESWWGVPALAAISALILSTKSGWVAGGSMSDSLIPTPTLLAYFGVFFTFGWLFSRHDDLQEVVERGAWLRFAAGALIAIPAFALFYDNADFTGRVGTAGFLAENDQLRIFGLFAVGLVCWLTLFGIWGILARYVRTESRALRYLADASFWIYLVHIPFLVALQSSLAQTHMEVVLRYALTVAGTLALAIGSYALVRMGRGLWATHARQSRRPGRQRRGRIPHPAANVN